MNTANTDVEGDTADYVSHIRGDRMAGGLRRAGTRRAATSAVLVAGWWLAVAAMTVLPVGRASADPSLPPAPPLPVFTPIANDWAPKFPVPYDATRKNVTDADIKAENEMCQWFKAQYVDLRRQMDDFGFDLLQANNDWTVPGIQTHADAVASNIEQAVAFLAPRAEAMTQSQDYAGDAYFPLYQGESFYRLWQHLSNTGVGIRARNTAWVYGPSQQRVEHWGSRIQRSHVCD